MNNVITKLALIVIRKLVIDSRLVMLVAEIIKDGLSPAPNTPFRFPVPVLLSLLHPPVKQTASPEKKGEGKKADSIFLSSSQHNLCNLFYLFAYLSPLLCVSCLFLPSPPLPLSSPTVLLFRLPVPPLLASYIQSCTKSLAFIPVSLHNPAPMCYLCLLPQFPSAPVSFPPLSFSSPPPQHPTPMPCFYLLSSHIPFCCSCIHSVGGCSCLWDSKQQLPLPFFPAHPPSISSC